MLALRMAAYESRAGWLMPKMDLLDVVYYV